MRMTDRSAASRGKTSNLRRTLLSTKEARLIAAAAAVLVIFALGAALVALISHGRRATPRPATAQENLLPFAAPAESRPYPISPAGGPPATGPGDRFNECERIWCTIHGENFFIDHFLTPGHVGWIVHDAAHGDVFLSHHRSSGPGYPNAAREALYLCGFHLHPYLLTRFPQPIHRTGFNSTLGYGRAHFNEFGTRLDPCCINGQGWAFLHSRDGLRFPFHELSEYRENPDIGWHRPFKARPPDPPTGG